MSNELTRMHQIDRDKAALAKPESAKEVMDIADRSARLTKALKGMKGYEEMYYRAFENMIEAYHVIGEELEKIVGDYGGDRKSKDFQDSVGILKISNVNISTKQSLEWRTIAKIPRIEIEAYIKSKEEESEPVTKAAILEIGRAFKTANEVCKEEYDKMLASLLTFLINSKHLIDHLRKFPDSRKAIPEEVFKQLETLARITDELNRAIM